MFLFLPQFISSLQSFEAGAQGSHIPYQVVHSVNSVATRLMDDDHEEKAARLSVFSQLYKVHEMS